MSSSPNASGLRVPPVGADRVGTVEVGKAQDVEEFGAWSRPEGVGPRPGAVV
jgi:hypothetical protein